MRTDLWSEELQSSPQFNTAFEANEHELVHVCTNKKGAQKSYFSSKEAEKECVAVVANVSVGAAEVSVVTAAEIPDVDVAFLRSQPLCRQQNQYSILLSISILQVKREGLYVRE